MKTFTYQSGYRSYRDVILRFGYYGNGRVAFELFSESIGPIAVATVNVPEAELAADEVAIKNYSENAGILEFLVKNDIVQETGNEIAVGYVKVPVCKLLVNPKDFSRIE